MKKQEKPKTTAKTTQKTDPNAKGYPLYPDKDDIFKKSKEEQDIDPEDVSQTKDDDYNYNEDVDELDSSKFGDDLDIPGAELDDEGEDIGSEDEENNYYSIGGDRHNDLDEDHDEDY